MRKKALLIGIACWWIGLPLLGLGLIAMQRWQLRREVAIQIAEALPACEWALLKVPASQQASLRWEHSREFELAGRMYDVVRDSAGADTAYYWCLRDEAEERLNREAEILIASGLRRPHSSEGSRALESVAWRLALPPARISFRLLAHAGEAGEGCPPGYAMEGAAPPAPPPEQASSSAR